MITLFTGIKHHKTSRLTKQCFLSRHAVSEARKHISVCADMNSAQVERWLRQALKEAPLVAVAHVSWRKWRRKGLPDRQCYLIRFRNKGMNGAEAWGRAYLIMEEKVGGHHLAITCLSATEYDNGVKRGVLSPQAETESDC